MEPTKTIERIKRALTTEMARIVRQRGHNDATEFALAIGLIHGYKNDPHAKKDVIDPSGDAHSVNIGGICMWRRDLVEIVPCAIIKLHRGIWCANFSSLSILVYANIPW